MKINFLDKDVIRGVCNVFSKQRGKGNNYFIDTKLLDKFDFEHLLLCNKIGHRTGKFYQLWNI